MQVAAILRTSLVALVAATLFTSSRAVADADPEWCTEVAIPSADELHDGVMTLHPGLSTADILKAAGDVQTKNDDSIATLQSPACKSAIAGSFIWLRRIEDGMKWARKHRLYVATPDALFQSFEPNLHRVSLRFESGAKPSEFSLWRSDYSLAPFTAADTGTSYDLWLEPGKWTAALGGKRWVLNVEGDCPEGLPLDSADTSLTLQCGTSPVIVPTPSPSTLGIELAGEWAPKISHAGGGTESVGVRYLFPGDASFFSLRLALRFVPDVEGGTLGRVDELVGAGFFIPAGLVSAGPFVDLSIWDVGPTYVGFRGGGRLSVNAATFLSFLLEGAVEGYPQSGSFAPVAETMGAGVAFNLGLR